MSITDDNTAEFPAPRSAEARLGELVTDAAGHGSAIWVAGRYLYVAVSRGHFLRGAPEPWRAVTDSPYSAWVRRLDMFSPEFATDWCDVYGTNPQLAALFKGDAPPRNHLSRLRWYLDGDSVAWSLQHVGLEYEQMTFERDPGLLARELGGVFNFQRPSGVGRVRFTAEWTIRYERYGARDEWTVARVDEREGVAPAGAALVLHHAAYDGNGAPPPTRAAWFVPKALVEEPDTFVGLTPSQLEERLLQQSAEWLHVARDEAMQARRLADRWLRVDPSRLAPLLYATLRDPLALLTSVTIDPDAKPLVGLCAVELLPTCHEDSGLDGTRLCVLVVPASLQGIRGQLRAVLRWRESPFGEDDICAGPSWLGEPPPEDYELLWSRVPELSFRPGAETTMDVRWRLLRGLCADAMPIQSVSPAGDIPF